jgi:hypothetical protein
MPSADTHQGGERLQLGRHWVQARDPNGGVGLNFQAAEWYRPPTWPEQGGEQAKMLHFEILVETRAFYV